MVGAELGDRSDDLSPAGIAVGLTTTVALARKLRPMRHPIAEAFRLAGRGNLFAGRILAGAITRAWWPAAIVASLCSRRVRRAVVAAAFVPATLDWWRDRPPLTLPSAIGLRLLDDVAYGAGVWAGVLRDRRPGPLIADLSNWPPRRRSRPN